MAARTGEYAKHMKPLIKTHNFDVDDPMTILRFPVQFKRACDPYKVSADMNLWTTATFTNVGSMSGTTIWMSPHKDAGSTLILAKTGAEQIFTYVKAADFLL